MDFTIKMLFTLAVITILINISCCHREKFYNQNLHQPHQKRNSASEPDFIDPFEMGSMPAPKPGWIDPFDMLGESITKDTLCVQSDVEIHVLKKRCSNSETYLRRFVNLFLHAGDLRDTPIMDYSKSQQIRLDFFVKGEDIKILRNFGQGEGDVPSIEAVNDVISRIFSQKKTPQDNAGFMSEEIISCIKKVVLKIVTSPEWTVISSVIMLLFLTLWLIFHSHSYRLAIFIVLMTIFLAGFGFTWIRMYEEAEIKRYVTMVTKGKAPRHCTEEAQSMAWYEHMYSRMFGVDCQSYYIERDVRPIVKISPTDVLAETLSSILINPGNNIATAYGNFITTATSQFPYLLQPFALPIMSIVPLIFIIILCGFLYGYRFTISITGMHLIPPDTHLSESEARRDSRYVEDCSRREPASSEQNNTFPLFLDSNAPLFVMNWKGLKKVSSSSLLGEKSGNKIKGETKEVINKAEKSLEESNEKMMEDLKEFESFVKSMENKKIMEGRKRRSIHTLTDGKSELKGVCTIGNTDLSSDDESRTSLNSEKEKGFKDKTL